MQRLLLSQFFYFFFPTSVLILLRIYIYIYIYIHTYLTTQRLYMNYRCYQITEQRNIFTQMGSCAKCLLDNYHWGSGLTVTGRTRAIGQNVLQSSFETGSSRSPSYCHIFFFITFLQEVFFGNIVIVIMIYHYALSIQYHIIIILCFNYKM